MHISDSMIQGAVCPVTAVVSSIGVGACAYFAYKSKEKPSSAKFGAVAAFIFAAQMINFTVQGGISGHLIGAVLAAVLLGFPFGVLAMTSVLVVQALVFSDGGLFTLGTNVLNMALIGCLMGGVINKYFMGKNSIKKSIAIGIASWLSVVLAAVACGFALSYFGNIEISTVLSAMFGVHAVIGIGEAVITVLAYQLLSHKSVSQVGILGLAAIIGVVLTPFASKFPDGLEWVVEKYQLLAEKGIAISGILSGYDAMGYVGLAGFVGVVVTFLLVYVVGRMLEFSAKAV